MMKESVTKFDFESAFKALDEIDIPIAEEGIKANRPALKEIFSRKSKFDSLFEEYYDISDTEALTDVQEAREAEIAKAKLARIEKIVDLDAESPEDLLTSYVGKYIMQCPQCMTLFYKDKEDIVESEEDPLTVNVNEVCQHCGNNSGYSLIGKVGETDTSEDSEATDEIPQEADNVELPADEDTEENPNENEETGEASEETTEEDSLEDVNFDDVDLDALDLDEEDEETEDDTKEESFVTPTGDVLVEELTEDADLSVSSEEFEKLINSAEFKEPISDASVRAMLADDKDTKDDEKEPEVKESLTEEIELSEAGIGDWFKNLFTKSIDKITDRAKRADWLLANALIDYDKAIVDKKGTVKVEPENKLFNVYLVLCYAGKDANGNKITSAPKNADGLLLGMKYPEVKTNYADAENIARGWSIKDGNGPAFIYIAKNAKGDGSAYLCQYFDGKLQSTGRVDRLEVYIDKVKREYEGSKAMAAGGLDQAEARELNASDIKKGMVIKTRSGEAEVIDIADSDLEGCYDIKIATDKGEKIYSVSATQKFTVVRDSITTESFDTFMSGLEELQEASLETQITNSLAETFDNINNFKITECSYLNEKLSVNGVMTFESGNTEDTTFVFTEALVIDNDKVSLVGCNESLGTKIAVTGRNVDRVFITESFN
jgi:hypothetical protein